MYIHGSGFENKNICSSMLDNILEGIINCKRCGIIAPLYMLFATSIQVIHKSIVKIHKSGDLLISQEKSARPDHLTSRGQQKA